MILGQNMTRLSLRAVSEEVGTLRKRCIKIWKKEKKKVWRKNIKRELGVGFKLCEALAYWGGISLQLFVLDLLDWLCEWL